MPDWIHVNEQLPEPRQDVIIALETMDEGLQVMMGYRMEDGRDAVGRRPGAGVGRSARFHHVRRGRRARSRTTAARAESGRGTWQLTGDLDGITIHGVLWWMPAPLPPGPMVRPRRGWPQARCGSRPQRPVPRRSSRPLRPFPHHRCASRVRAQP